MLFIDFKTGNISRAYGENSRSELREAMASRKLTSR